MSEETDRVYVSLVERRLTELKEIAARAGGSEEAADAYRIDPDEVYGLICIIEAARASEDALGRVVEWAERDHVCDHDLDPCAFCAKATKVLEEWKARKKERGA